MSNAVADAQNADWRGYVQFCAEMDALYHGHFYDQATGPKLWRDKQYWGKTRAIMERHVMRVFPELANQFSDELVKFGWPLIWKTTNTLASSFREWVDVRLIHRETGEEVLAKETDYAGLVRRWPRIYEDSGNPETFIQCETYRELHRGCFYWARIVEGEVIPEPLPPHKTKIDPHPLVPRKIEIAQSITVPLSGQACVDDEATNWVRFRRVPNPGNGFTSVWQVDVQDPSGDLIADVRDLPSGERELVPADLEATSAGGESKINGYPISAWRAMPTKGAYPEPDWAGHDEQIGINLLFIELTEAFRLGTLGQWWIKGEEPRGYDATTGRAPRPKRTVGHRSVWMLDSGAETGMLEARTQIAPLIDAVEKLLKLAAVARNLPPYIMDTGRQPSNVSGEARREEGSHLELQRKQREIMLARDAERSLDVWQKVWNIVHPPGDAEHIPPELGFKVLFSPLPSGVIDQSSAQAKRETYAMGTESRYRDVQMRERLTRREAEGKVNARLRKQAEQAAQHARILGDSGARPKAPSASE